MNSAYERWYEARKLWTTLKIVSRNLGRHVRVFCQTGLETQWLAAMNAKAHGQSYDVPGDLKREDLEREQAMKQSMLRLVVAYPYSLMYHLRGEDPLTQPFLMGMLPMMDAMNNPTGYGLNNRIVSESGRPIPMPTTAGIRNPYNYYTSITQDVGQRRHFATTFNLPGGWSVGEEYNVPMQIVELQARWIQKYDKEKSSLLPFLNTLIDTQSQLERILTTPLPLSYVTHLKQILFIYMLCLPFQLIRIYQYYSILIAGLVAFVMFGFEAIGVEIENPLGYDVNDIDMAALAKIMREEMEYAANLTMPPVDLWNTPALSTVPGVASNGFGLSNE